MWEEGAMGVVWGVSSPMAMAYVYFGVARLPRGVPRLVASLPLVALYVYWGRGFGTVFERGMYSFFFIWLTAFKVALLCWDQGPAADPWAVASFPRFLAVMNLSLQIKRQKFAERRRKGAVVGESSSTGRRRSDARAGVAVLKAMEGSQEMPVVVVRLLFKFVCLGLIIYACKFRDAMHVAVVSLLYSFDIYVACSLIFEGVAAVVSPWMGIELEPAFDKPFMAHSLGDFWGKRWNLLVSNLLRVAIYDPVLKTLLWRERQSTLWPRSVATFACFLVSGLMHELIFYNMTRRKPTWEVTWFFILNGAATVVEGALRRKTTLRLPKLVSIPLTLSFVLVTAIWYFYPPLVNSGAADDAVAEFTYFFQSLLQMVGRSDKSLKCA